MTSQLAPASEAEGGGQFLLKHQVGKFGVPLGRENECRGVYGKRLPVIIVSSL